MGLENVSHLAGGFTEWRNAGGDVQMKAAK